MGSYNDWRALEEDKGKWRKMMEFEGWNLLGTGKERKVIPRFDFWRSP